MSQNTEEDRRLAAAWADVAPWLKWGPYLSERQWGTVREDYSPYGNAWDSFPHDHARSRAYRWGEDGIAGLCDDRQILCFALGLWNGNDPILKERMFGLTNSEGNHGEDVKEVYFFQDSTPSHSYMRMLYKYPQRAFPYADLVAENGRRKGEPGSFEYELIDTGAFAESRYFDVTVEYAKRGPEDILIRVTAANRGPDAHDIWLLPTLWFRDTWSWSKDAKKPVMRAVETAVEATHPVLGTRRLVAPGADEFLFCENETNAGRLYGAPGPAFPKDGINDHIVSGASTVNPARTGTKAAAFYRRGVPAGGAVTITLCLTDDGAALDLGGDPGGVFDTRLQEADAFYATRIAQELSADQQSVARQAYAGMLWSKQYFHYIVADWLDGDDIAPPPERLHGRNADWRHFYAEDIISMPDTWEYPWFASWDLCFQAVVLARVDLEFAKQQILLLCREWYMSPDGQIPAYEWAFDDVNPPLQTWAALQIIEYERATTGTVDTDFLRRVFKHGLLYFTWWVNRKDADGNNLFQGGFLGLDNISVFDRSSASLPGGGRLYQSDGTTWVGVFALRMMEIACELSKSDPTFSDFATKFFQHFVYIADALDHCGRASDGGAELWDEAEGLFFDVLRIGDRFIPLKVRSLVSVIPAIAVASLDLTALDRDQSGNFSDRIDWFRKNQSDLLDKACGGGAHGGGDLLLTFLSRDGLVRLLRSLLDEAEFLSAYGIRSLSKRHETAPFGVEIDGQRFEAGYQPAESGSGLFGGNSNWRGPVWMPMNFIIVDALRHYHRHYGETLTVECPTGSGTMMTLGEVADELSRRLASIFMRDASGRRPVYGGSSVFQSDPAWRDNVLFYEYFHGDNGAGIGASHQTGWTGLAAVLLETGTAKAATNDHRVGSRPSVGAASPATEPA